MRSVNVITRLIRREPVAFQGCVQATLAALAGFGVVTWSSEQVGLMLAVVAAFLALFTRASVTPTSEVRPAAGDDDAGDARVEANGSLRPTG
jgi:hypothetical protein